MGKSGKIVVVDDEPDLGDVLKWELERNNHKVVVVQNWKQALEMVESFQPHFFISDFHLPGMNGVELIKQASERSKPGLKCFLITGESFGLNQDLKSLNIVRVFHKPFKLESISEEINSHLGDIEA